MIRLLYYIIRLYATKTHEMQNNKKNEIPLICANFGADLINTFEVTSHRTKWPRFLSHPMCVCVCVLSQSAT